MDVASMYAAAKPQYNTLLKQLYPDRPPPPPTWAVDHFARQQHEMSKMVLMPSLRGLSSNQMALIKHWLDGGPEEPEIEGLEEPPRAPAAPFKLFFTFSREQVINNLQRAGKPTEIATVAQTITHQWQNMSTQQKAVWHRITQRNMAEYNQKIAGYNRLYGGKPVPPIPPQLSALMKHAPETQQQIAAKFEREVVKYQASYAEWREKVTAIIEERQEEAREAEEEAERLNSCQQCRHLDSYKGPSQDPLLQCGDCGRRWHRLCLDPPLLVVRPGWRCSECKICESCDRTDQDDKLVLCERCDLGYHTFCAAPPLPQVPSGQWLCEKCVSCVRCGSRTPGDAEGARWHSDWTLCETCVKLTRLEGAAVKTRLANRVADRRSGRLNDLDGAVPEEERALFSSDSEPEGEDAFDIDVERYGSWQSMSGTHRGALVADGGEVDDLLDDPVFAGSSTKKAAAAQADWVSGKGLSDEDEVSDVDLSSSESESAGGDTDDEYQPAAPRRRGGGGRRRTVVQEESDDDGNERCPVCRIVFDPDTPAVACDECETWVHAMCDGVDDVLYQRFQVDEGLNYFCSKCRPKGAYGIMGLGGWALQEFDRLSKKQQEQRDAETAQSLQELRRSGRSHEDAAPTSKPSQSADEDELPSHPNLPPRVPYRGLFTDDNVICALCQRSTLDSDCFDRLRLYHGLETKDGVLQYAHWECVVWSPEVFQDAKGFLMNVTKAVQRGHKLYCAHCRMRGATVGCMNKTCKRSYHQPCLPNVRGAKLNYEEMNMFCPQHNPDGPSDELPPLPPGALQLLQDGAAKEGAAAGEPQRQLEGAADATATKPDTVAQPDPERTATPPVSEGHAAAEAKPVAAEIAPAVTVTTTVSGDGQDQGSDAIESEPTQKQTTRDRASRHQRHQRQTDEETLAALDAALAAEESEKGDSDGDDGAKFRGRKRQRRRATRASAVHSYHGEDEDEGVLGDVEDATSPSPSAPRVHLKLSLPVRGASPAMLKAVEPLDAPGKEDVTSKRPVRLRLAPPRAPTEPSPDDTPLLRPSGRPSRRVSMKVKSLNESDMMTHVGEKIEEEEDEGQQLEEGNKEDEEESQARSPLLPQKVNLGRRIKVGAPAVVSLGRSKTAGSQVRIGIKTHKAEGGDKDVPTTPNVSGRATRSRDHSGSTAAAPSHSTQGVTTSTPGRATRATRASASADPKVVPPTGTADAYATASSSDEHGDESSEGDAARAVTSTAHSRSRRAAARASASAAASTPTSQSKGQAKSNAAVSRRGTTPATRRRPSKRKR